MTIAQTSMRGMMSNLYHRGKRKREPLHLIGENHDKELLRRIEKGFNQVSPSTIELISRKDTTGAGSNGNNGR